MKALVLGGIGCVTVVDACVCSAADLGENYAVNASHVASGLPRCAAIIESLLGLNDNVSGSYVEDTLTNILEKRAEFFEQFTLVVATQLREKEAMALDKVCRGFGVKALFVRSHGMVGVLRASVREHCIIESKPDHLPHDLRLSNPWPELSAFAESFRIGDGAKEYDLYEHMDDMTFKHVPYVVLLLHMLEQWKRTHDGEAPCTSADLRELKANIRAMLRKGDEENIREAVAAAHRLISPKPSSSSSSSSSPSSAATVPSEVAAVLNDPAARLGDTGAAVTNFWIIVSALREFVYGDGADDNGTSPGGGCMDTDSESESRISASSAGMGTRELPIDGSLPDMTSTTESYLALQEVYTAKAASDADAVYNIVRRKLAEMGRDDASISPVEVKHMCKHARCLQVVRHASLEEEMQPTDLKRGKIEQLLEDETTTSCTLFYLLLRAVDRAYESLNRYPGEFNEELENDISTLRSSAVSILGEYGLSQNLNLPLGLLDDYAKEVCRYGSAELHVVSAILGGIAAQESLKLILGQYIPIAGTYVFDAVHMLGATIAL